MRLGQGFHSTTGFSPEIFEGVVAFKALSSLVVLQMLLKVLPNVYSLNLTSTLIYVCKLCFDRENFIQFSSKRNEWSFYSNIIFKKDINKDEKSRISQILHVCHQLFFFTFINEELL